MRTAVADIDNGLVPTCGIAVMAKASFPGCTKTRLVPPLTFDEAAKCNTAFLRDIADNILTTSAQASIAGPDGRVAGAPDHRSVSLGQCTEISHSRQRPSIRCCIQGSCASNGDSGPAHGVPFALAKWAC